MYVSYGYCFRHPLFPLLALLFERCEQATQSAAISNSESFNMDIQAFVQHQERDRKPFLINDTEIDGLVSVFYILHYVLCAIYVLLGVDYKILFYLNSN